MHMGMRLVCAFAVVGLGLGISGTFLRTLTVETEQGKVHGKTINGGKVKAFLGLPYAAPPIGDMRWKAPAPPAKWKGKRHATKFERAARRTASTTIWSFKMQVRARIACS